LTQREVDTAGDVAAVLDCRLDPTHTRGATPRPLPWLPGLPHPLATHPYWGDYLAQRQQHVEAAASALRASVDEWTPTSAPGWARQLLTPTHRLLLQDLAVFRAAHGVADDDTRPTGPRQQAAADRRAQVALNERDNQAVDASYRTAWTPLAVQVGLTPRSDPHWPTLAENLAALSRAGADTPALMRRAAAEGPLPDEYQAAALWWPPAHEHGVGGPATRIVDCCHRARASDSNYRPVLPKPGAGHGLPHPVEPLTKGVGRDGDTA